MEHFAGIMHANSHTQSVLEMVRRKGLLRPSDLLSIGVPRMVVTRLTNNGKLERVGRGLYRLADSKASEHESLAAVATKVP